MDNFISTLRAMSRFPLITVIFCLKILYNFVLLSACLCIIKSNCSNLKYNTHTLKQPQGKYSVTVDRAAGLFTDYLETALDQDLTWSWRSFSITVYYCRELQTAYTWSDIIDSRVQSRLAFKDSTVDKLIDLM